ncbi:helix-turn-helix domain-containing protein [Arthrobacter sp. USHLN218]|uniref:helix-turn-helix domain-containing protein n=1 Tax=Arthrobacter sp. USHLN218 TaxID=3081232 RepID=UPI00301A859F
MRAALRRLIAQGLTMDLQIDHIVPREIQNSWRRSISSKVDPAGQPRIEDIGAREDLIQAAAGRVMDRWYASLSNTRTTLLLGNAAGQIVWRRTVDARDRRTLDVVGAVEGGDFSERVSGTNGVGTSIEARSPILIRGSQHFLESLRDVACAAAPVIHPLTGRIVGSVSLTVAAQEANDYMVSVARQASQEIADSLLEGANSRDVALARAFRRARAGRRGVLVMNRDSIMSDLPALARLDGETQAQIWDQLATRLGAGEERAFNLADIGLSALVTNVGQASEPVLELRLLSPADTREEKRAGAARSVVPELPRASAPPPAEADEAVAAWWADLTDYAKSHLGNELVITAPRGSDAETWVRAWSAATGRAARAVAIPPGVDSRGRRDQEPGTDDSPPGGAVPTFPPLRLRRSALAELARKAYRGPGPGPRFTGEALSALLSWYWPGDLAELADLVARLPHPEAGPWIIDVAELPPHMASVPRRRLSRWEQAERDSLLQALTDSGGIKSDAAELLGIGRTTLYRKLRALSIDQRQIDALSKPPDLRLPALLPRSVNGALGGRLEGDHV